MVSLSLVLALACSGEPLRTSAAPNSYKSQNPAVANFRIALASRDDPELSAKCELALESLRKDWFGMEAIAWRPPCDLVVHRSRDSYLQAVGAAGRSTLGSARVTVERGQILERRIDLLATNREDMLKSLRHELIHLLFVDRFPNRPPPRWAEEGLALMADAAAKQDRHRRDLEYAVSNNQLIPLPQLLATREYPKGWQCSTARA